MKRSSRSRMRKTRRVWVVERDLDVLEGNYDVLLSNHRWVPIAAFLTRGDARAETEARRDFPWTYQRVRIRPYFP